MNLLNKLKIVVLLGILAAGSAFGQETLKNRSLARQMPRAVTAGKISAENVNFYYIGYDFDAIPRYMKDDEKFRDSITQMTILWDELYQQPEASDIEALMRMTVRGSGTLEMRLARLEKAKTAYEKRVTGEGRWYYNVGLTYSQAFTALNAKDVTTFKQKLAALGTLSKGSPAGTPSDFVAALAKLGTFSTKAQFTSDDIAALGTQCDVIDGIITA
jgi:hypothetical protein